MDMGEGASVSPTGQSTSPRQEVTPLNPLDEAAEKLLYIRSVVEAERSRLSGMRGPPTTTASDGLRSPSESLETLRCAYPTTATCFVLLACKNRHVDVLRLLLQLGCPADPDDTDDDEFTAFHYALHWNDSAMLKLLLNHWPLWPFGGTRLVIESAVPDRSPDVHRVCSALKVDDAAGLSDEAKVHLQEELDVRYFWSHLLKLADFTLESSSRSASSRDILGAIIGCLKVTQNYLETFVIQKGLCHRELCLLLFSLVAENFQKLLTMKMKIPREAFKKAEVPLTRILLPQMEYRRFQDMQQQLRSLKTQLLADGGGHSMAWAAIRLHLREMTVIQKWFRSYRYGSLQQQRELGHLVEVFSDLESAFASNSVGPKCPEGGPYDAYQLMKDISALDSILRYTDLALSQEVQQDPRGSQMVIERSLQVVGEYCKGTEESPHLSKWRQDELRKAGLPIDRVSSLRNLLSHCSVASALIGTRVEVADEYRIHLLEKVQRDLRKIRTLLVKFLQRLELKKVRLMISEMQFLEQFQNMDDGQRCLFARLQSCKSLEKQRSMLTSMSEGMRDVSEVREIARAADHVLLTIRFREVSERLLQQEAIMRPFLKVMAQNRTMSEPKTTRGGLASQWVADIRDFDWQTIAKSSVTAITYPRGIDEFMFAAKRKASASEGATLCDVIVQTIMEGVWFDTAFKKMCKKSKGKFGFESSLDVRAWRTHLAKIGGVKSELTSRIDLLIAVEDAAATNPVRFATELEALATDMNSANDQQTLEEQIRKRFDVDDKHSTLFLGAFRTSCVRVWSDRTADELLRSVLHDVSDSVGALLGTGERQWFLERVERQLKEQKVKRYLDTVCDGVGMLSKVEFDEWMDASKTDNESPVDRNALYQNRRKCKEALRRVKCPMDLLWNAMAKEKGLCETCESFEVFLESLKSDAPSSVDFVRRAFREQLEQRFEAYFCDNVDVLRRLLVDSGSAVPEEDGSISEGGLLDLCACDANLRSSVEMLVLKLLSTLNEVVQPKLSKDPAQPQTSKDLEVLLNWSVRRSLDHGIGLSIRNYLAHGDAVVDLLDPSVRSAVAIAALILARNGRALLALGKMMDTSAGRTVLKRVLSLEASETLLWATRYADCIQTVLQSDYFRRRPWRDDLLDVLEHRAAGHRQDGRLDFLLHRTSELEMVSAACLDHWETLKFGIVHGCPVRWTNIERWTLLHFAAEQGNRSTVEVLLDHGADPNAACLGGHTPLHLAVFGGHDDVVHVLLAGHADATAPNDTGDTALHLAAMFGHRDLVDVLAQNGAPVDSTDRYLRSAMHLAAWNGQSDAVGALLDLGATIGDADVDGITPASYAALEGHVNVVRALLDKDRSAVGSEIDPVSPMIAACGNGHVRVVKLLMDYGVKGDGRQRTISKPLLVACRGRHYDVVQELLVGGANVDGRTEPGSLTVLHLVADMGDLRIAQCLVNRDVDIEMVTDDGQSALHLAAVAGHFELVQLLLEQGAKVNVTTPDGITPLHLAVEQGHHSIVEALLRKGAAVDATFTKTQEVVDGPSNVEAKNWPLQMAAFRGDANVVRTLLEHDANVHQSDELQSTALHYAAAHGHTEVAAALLQGGSAVDVKQDDGCTALHLAAANGHCDVVRALLRHGANVDATTRDNKLSPMHLAVQYGMEEVLQPLFDHDASHCADIEGAFPIHMAAIAGSTKILATLLRNGVDVNAVAANGNTALHLACEQRNQFRRSVAEVFPLSVVETLVTQKSVDVDAPNKFKMTSLHIAADGGDAEVVQVLLDRGANPDVFNYRSETPLQLATKGDHLECCRLLQDGGKSHRINLGASDCGACAAGGPDRALVDAVLCGHAPLVHRLTSGTGRVGLADDHIRLLHASALDGDVEVVRELLDAGAEIRATDASGLTALHIAAFVGQVDVVQLLLTRGADVDQRTTDGKRRTAVHFAADGGDRKMLELLKTKGARMDEPDAEGATPLILCSRKGFVDIARILMDGGARVDADVAGKDGPVHAALIGGHRRLASLLLLSWPDGVNARGDGGRSPMHCCATVGDLEMAKYLLDQEANPNVADDAGLTAVHTAAHRGDLEFVRLLLDAGAEIRQRTETLLHVAARGGHDAVVAFLLLRGANVDAVGVEGRSPLHEAIPAGHYGIVETLIDAGAKVNAADVNGDTPLILAVQEGHWGIVNLLLTSNADVDAVSGDGWTPVHLAVIVGDAPILDLLLDSGADVDSRGKDHRTPLHLAAVNGRNDLVQFLLTKRARVDAVDDSDEDALRLACLSGFVDVVHSLVDAGADVSGANDTGHFPLMCAAKNNNSLVVHALLDRGAKIDALGKDNQTALTMAIASWSLEVAEILLKRGANVRQGVSCVRLAAARGAHTLIPTILILESDVDDHSDLGITPLHVAALWGQVDAVLVLLENGADVSATNIDGLTILREAIDHRNPYGQLLDDDPSLPDSDNVVLLYAEIADVLGDRDARVAEDSAISERLTALHVACWRGSVPVVEALLAKKAEVDAVDGSGRTPLSWAAAEGHLGVVATLLEARALVDLGDDNGRTPLHWAALGGHSDVVDLLLQRGATVDSPDSSRCSPLLLAVRHGHWAVVLSLICRGADVNARGDDHLVALFWAVSRGDPELVRILLENGADVALVDEAGLTALQYAIVVGAHLDSTGSDPGDPLANDTVSVAQDVDSVADAEMDDLQAPHLLTVILGYLDVTHGGAEPMARDCVYMMALHFAVEESRQPDILEESGDRGAVPKEERRDAYAAIVQLLIANDSPVDSIDVMSCSALHRAAFYGHVDAIRLLLERGADVEIRDAERKTPLHHAASCGHADVVHHLIARGATVDARTSSDTTPLYLACRRGHVEVVEVLVEAGADPTARNLHDDTVLHASVGSRRVDVVTKILDRLESDHSDVREHLDVVDAEGDSPLMWAVEVGAADVVQMLLSKGADVNLKNGDGKTALDWASTIGDEGVAQVLRHFGAIHGDAISET